MSDLILTPPPPDDLPFRDPHPLPDLAPTLDDFGAHPAAKEQEQLGIALRAGLGIGALAILPDLIADLRRTRDPDTRLKFLALAFKEGGYGTKEDKQANLPVFHFNFVNSGGAVTVSAASVPDAEEIAFTDSTNLLASKVSVINDDFSPTNAEFSSVLELIDGS